MRRAAHMMLTLIGAVPWLIAYFMGLLCVGLAWLADKVWPDADAGNCWSYALHRWVIGRGALVLTFVEDARFLQTLPVIHCTWMPEGPGRAPLEMTQPVERQTTLWLPWWAFYFRYRVVKIERRKRGD